jgi:putative ABC transport system permease protein
MDVASFTRRPVMNTWIEGVVQDFRLAFKTLRANPAFTATVTLSLALAIGASSSAFSVVDAVRFRALPFPDADRLILVAEVPATQAPGTAVSANACRVACSVAFTTYQNTLSRVHLRTMDAIAAHVSGIKALTVNGESESVLGGLVSDSIFAMMKVAPVIGRAFSAEDHKLGAAPVTLLSHELWTTRFGAAPSAIGTVVQLSDTRYTVIGVMPQGFDFESGSKFWLPAVPSLDPSTRPSIRSVTVIARLARGATLEQARAELSALELPAPSRGAEPVKLSAAPLRARYTEASRNHDVVFLAVVLAVVLIACVNLTNLLLTRGLDQRREFAVRSALGAEPSRLARGLLAQHALLAIAGTTVGLLVARVFLGIVRAVAALDTFRPTGMDYRIDWRVAGFAALLAGIAAAAMSVLPVRLVLASRAQDALRESASSAPGGEGASRIQRAFVLAQVAFAVTLLVSAGLTVRTTLRLARVDLGFNADNLIQASPSLPHDWRVKEKYLPAVERIEQTLRAIPGVSRTATRATNALGSSRQPAQVTLQGEGAPLARASSPSFVIAVDSGYFGALEVPVTRGRAFTAEDRETAMPVAIVNEWAARRWWSGREAIGAQLRIDTLPGQSVTLTVVGVVRDNKATGSLLVANDGPELYRPFAQAPSAFPLFYARAANPGTLLRPIRVQLGAIVLGRPTSATIVSETVKRQLAGVTATSRQIVALAVVGLVLALIGVYGVLAYSVNRRTRELGIRRALGESASGVYALVVRDALKVTAPGVILGLLGALYVGRFVAPLLYGTSPTDTVTYAAISLIVLATGVVSALIPAARAARVSPMTALRGS